MIRGFIEQATPEVVSGWIFAQDVPLRGQRVLAMLDSECVGVGVIEYFRQDLLDAGLGDGYLGFHMTTNRLLTPREAARVVIRLEGSDASLLQRGARVEAGEAPAEAAEHAAGPATFIHTEASIAWLRERGALSEREVEFLAAITRFGAYDHDLPDHSDPESLHASAGPLIEAFAMRKVSLSRQEIDSIDELGAVKVPASVPILALWGSAEGRIGIAEASHLDPEGDGAAMDAFTDYRFGPRRLLFLHRACRFAPRRRATGGQLIVFTGA